MSETSNCSTSAPKLVSILNFRLSSDYFIVCHWSFKFSFMTKDTRHLVVFGNHTFFGRVSIQKSFSLFENQIVYFLLLGV